MLSRIRYLDGVWTLSLAMALALALALSACGGSSSPAEEAEDEAGGVDATEITLSGTTPSGKGLALTFPEEMDRESVEASITMTVGGPIANLVASPLLASWTVEPSYIWDSDSKRVRIYPLPYCRDVNLSLSAGYRTAAGAEGEALDLNARSGKNPNDFAYDADAVDGMPMCGSTIFFNDRETIYGLTGTQVRYKYNGKQKICSLGGNEDVWQLELEAELIPMRGISADGGATVAVREIEDPEAGFGFLHGYDLVDTSPVSSVGTDLEMVGAVSPIGDLNGDGIGDWAVRELVFDEGKHLGGTLYTHYILGAQSFADTLLGDIEIVPLAAVTYSESFPPAYTICGAAGGNFNGDVNAQTGYGYGDLAVCLNYGSRGGIGIDPPMHSYSKNSIGRYGLQEIWTLSGGDSLEADPKAGALIYNNPIVSGYQIPMRSAMAGADVNGDEKHDLIVPFGAVELEFSSSSKKVDGAIYSTVGALVILKEVGEQSDPLDWDLADAVSTEIVFASQHDKIMGGVMAPGDLNGDGREDFLIVVMDMQRTVQMAEVDPIYYLFGFLGRDEWPERIEIDPGAADPLARGFDFAIVFADGGELFFEENMAQGFEVIGNVDNDDFDDILIRNYSYGDNYDLLYFGSKELSGGRILEAADANAYFAYCW